MTAPADTPSNGRSYYAMIPNMIDDDPRIDAAAFRVYSHLRRVVGETGVYARGARALASHCHMSLETVTAAKLTLVACGYIKVDRIQREKDGRWTDCISVVDVWQVNADRYSNRTLPLLKPNDEPGFVTQTEPDRSEQVTLPLLKPNATVTLSGTTKEEPTEEPITRTNREEPSERARRRRSAPSSVDPAVSPMTAEAIAAEVFPAYADIWTLDEVQTSVAYFLGLDAAKRWGPDKRLGVKKLMNADAKRERERREAQQARTQNGGFNRARTYATASVNGERASPTNGSSPAKKRDPYERWS